MKEWVIHLTTNRQVLQKGFNQIDALIRSGYEHEQVINILILKK